jgi:hypothetical protein
MENNSFIKKLSILFFITALHLNHKCIAIELPAQEGGVRQIPTPVVLFPGFKGGGCELINEKEDCWNSDKKWGTYDYRLELTINGELKENPGHYSWRHPLMKIFRQEEKYRVYVSTPKAFYGLNTNYIQDRLPILSYYYNDWPKWIRQHLDTDWSPHLREWIDRAREEVFEEIPYYYGFHVDTVTYGSNRYEGKVNVMGLRSQYFS